MPFAGVWQGTITMTGSMRDAGMVRPLGVRFDIIDAANKSYSGALRDGPFPGTPAGKVGFARTAER